MKRLVALMICLIFVVSLVDVAMAAPKEGRGYDKEDFKGIGPSGKVGDEHEKLTGPERAAEVAAQNAERKGGDEE